MAVGKREYKRYTNVKFLQSDNYIGVTWENTLLGRYRLKYLGMMSATPLLMGKRGHL